MRKSFNTENPGKMNPFDGNEHLLGLKVMRLSRPTLVGPQLIYTEPGDLMHDAFQQMMRDDGTAVPGPKNTSVGQFLLLPQSFGSVYLGETFSSYICVHSRCTDRTVEGVTLKAYIQTNENRVNLMLKESSGKPNNLAPGQTLDDIIYYEVKEIGSHILVCEVNYFVAGQLKYFRKFFKFPVLKPLDIKTKFFNAEMDEIYLEAQIQNITTTIICLEKVELDSTEEYTVTPLNTLPNGESVFSVKNMLPPNNSCQFLYCIKPKPEIAKDLKLLKQSVAVGKLNIVWRSNMGERGCLQTSPLERCLAPQAYEDIRLEVIEALNIIKIGQRFSFKCRVTNTTDYPMHLTVKLPVKLCPSSSFIGAVDMTLGTIGSGQYEDFTLTVQPTRLGLVKVSPLILINSMQKKEYTIEKVVEVFVTDDDHHHDEEDARHFQNIFVRYDRGYKRDPNPETGPLLSSLHLSAI